jgi:hypothetical protein
MPRGLAVPVSLALGNDALDPRAPEGFIPSEGRVGIGQVAKTLGEDDGEDEYREAVCVAEIGWLAGVIADLKAKRITWSEEWIREIAARKLDPLASRT